MLIILVVILLLGGVGAGVYFWWQSTHPRQVQTEQTVALTDQEAEALYFAAIENHMNTPYIIQKAEQTSSIGSTKLTMRLEAVSDFSDPKNSKTKLSYTAAGEKTPKDDSTMEYEQIALDSMLYVKTPKDSPESSGLYKNDQWYFVAADNVTGKFMFDPFNVAEGVNTPLGQVLVGKFSNEIRKELMTFIKENKVYKVTSHKADAVNGQQAQRFTVELDVKKSDELNEKTAQLLGIKNVLAGRSEGAPIIDQFDVWVGRTDKKLKKAHFSIDDAGTKVGSSTFTFEYPAQSPEITKPADVIEAPRQ